MRGEFSKQASEMGDREDVREARAKAQSTFAEFSQALGEQKEVRGEEQKRGGPGSLVLRTCLPRTYYAHVTHRRGHGRAWVVAAAVAAAAAAAAAAVAAAAAAAAALLSLRLQNVMLPPGLLTGSPYLLHRGFVGLWVPRCMMGA